MAHHTYTSSINIIIIIIIIITLFYFGKIIQNKICKNQARKSWPTTPNIQITKNDKQIKTNAYLAIGMY